MFQFSKPLFVAGLLCVSATSANATLISLGACTGAVSCLITTTPPNPVVQDPNDGVLLAWDEVQNFELQEDLFVDRVFDDTADFIGGTAGNYFIKAGTIVSSHYIQWDPGNGSSTRVQTTITADSQIYAFLTADQKLFDSDDILGLPGLDYNDFNLRGLEGSDTTVFSGLGVTIDWGASSPGDWTRLITAFSPGGADPPPIPLPAAGWLLIGALGGLAAVSRKARKDR